MHDEVEIGDKIVGRRTLLDLHWARASSNIECRVGFGLALDMAFRCGITIVRHSTL